MTTSSGTIAMTIKCCADCPFFGGLPLIGALAAALSPEGSLAKAGTCNLDRDTGTLIQVPLGLVGPEREEMVKALRKRLPVLDRTTIPEQCPLRTGDVVVTLGS